MVASIAIRPSSITVNTPTGWTAIGNWAGSDGGTEATNSGTVRYYWFSKVADGTEGTATQTFTHTGTATNWIGSIMSVRSATGAYSLSAGGYSVNSDATDSSGTLDTDIDMTQGDLILFAGAQAGNPSGASGEDISANGITSKSTVIEQGEYADTHGNHAEVDLSSTLIWEGTSTSTPAVSFTQSVGIAGVVSALRIKTGIRNEEERYLGKVCGIQAAGSATVAVPYPEHEVGDLFVLYVGNRDDTSTPTTPTGWTSLGTYNGGHGSFAQNTGNARISAYYQQATQRRSGTVTVILTLPILPLVRWWFYIGIISLPGVWILTVDRITPRVLPGRYQVRGSICHLQVEEISFW